MIEMFPRSSKWWCSYRRPKNYVEDYVRDCSRRYHRIRIQRKYPFESDNVDEHRFEFEKFNEIRNFLEKAIDLKPHHR